MTWLDVKGQVVTFWFRYMVVKVSTAMAKHHTVSIYVLTKTSAIISYFLYILWNHC